MRFSTLLVLTVSLLVPIRGYSSATVKTSEITNDKLGQLVTVEGKAYSFRASRGQRSPNSFMLRDAAGAIRVVIWPEEFRSIANRKALETEGVTVRLEGEVAEYRGNLEMHVPDSEQVKILSGSSSSSSTTGTATSANATTRRR